MFAVFVKACTVNMHDTHKFNIACMHAAKLLFRENLSEIFPVGQVSVLSYTYNYSYQHAQAVKWASFFCIGCDCIHLCL